MRQDQDYTLTYLSKQKRYHHLNHAIHASRVYPDPVYPLQACIVELPFSLDFRCEAVFWQASRLSHRLPITRPDHLEFFAVLSSCDKEGKELFKILFVGEQVFKLWKRWCYFIDKKGKNLIKWYYQGRQKPTSRYVNYERGCVWGDHPHLQKVLSGLTV